MSAKYRGNKTQKGKGENRRRISLQRMVALNGRGQDKTRHYISNRFFQFFSYIIDRVHQNCPTMHFRMSNTDSGGPIRIQEGQYGFRRANTDSGGPIRIQEGQYGTVYGF